MLEQSKEFQVFRDGLNVNICASVPSLIDVSCYFYLPFMLLTPRQEILQSSKTILITAYNRRITSGIQLIPLLTYKVFGDDEEFERRMTDTKPKLVKAIERYFLGTGHPNVPLFNDIVAPTRFEADNKDPGYRAKRFVKMLSGISLLPPKGIKFIVRFTNCISY